MPDSNSTEPQEQPNATPDYRVEPVPKVPRKIGWRWAVSDIIRIVFLIGLLSLIIVARKPCSNSVAGFVDAFSDIDAAVAPAPEQMKLERLTEEEIQRRFGGNDSEDAKTALDAGAPATP